MFGNIVADLTYLLVYSFLGDHKGAYWLLLVAPLIEGSLGGAARLICSSCIPTEAPLKVLVLPRQISTLMSRIAQIPPAGPAFSQSSWD